MKRENYLIIITAACLFILFGSPRAEAQIFQKIKEQVKQTADQRAVDKASKTTNTTADNADTLTAKGTKKIKSVFKSKSKTSTDAQASQSNTNQNGQPVSNGNDQQSTNQAQKSATPNNGTQNTTGLPASLSVYQNYDFISGDKIVFNDDFSTDQIGEFPSHWGMVKGQGTVNQSGDKIVFNILEGNYAVMRPLVKSKQYLEDAFTVELDYFSNTGSDCGYGVNVFFADPEGNEDRFIDVGRYKTASSSYFENEELGTKDQNGTTVDVSDEDFYNHWHHIAIAYKKPQMKVYIDQNRVLVIPNIGFQPKAILFGGLAGDQSCPIGISNVRIANGGSQNMISSIFSNGNVFVTHGITFDINKATLKPESMGVINQIYGYLDQNKNVKVEIDGHTDNSGTAEHNLSLSKDRAEAVKMQLVSMGIDPGRITTKGLGDTHPITSNDTPEGKAGNRRVEFVKV